MIRKLLILLLASCLTFLIGITAFAKDLEDHQMVSFKEAHNSCSFELNSCQTENDTRSTEYKQYMGPPSNHGDPGGPGSSGGPGGPEGHEGPGDFGPREDLLMVFMFMIILICVL